MYTLRRNVFVLAVFTFFIFVMASLPAVAQRVTATLQVSTLNAADGAVTSNMAIVPNINGKTDAYASGITQLIVDISGYFAP